MVFQGNLRSQWKVSLLSEGSYLFVIFLVLNGLPLYFFLSLLEASKGAINGKERSIGDFFWDELAVIWGSIW